jgi:purine-nucleoside phosphorylase
MVLGSGLGPIADEVQDATVIPYAEIPHFHAPAVQGHPGKMVIGMFNGVPSLVLQVWVGRWGGGGTPGIAVECSLHA